jgi:phthiocerol/phenolphthiocerol synthesis type-I polyketide synthase E
MNHDEDNQQLQGIAIIGLAGRFPGGRNAREYWQGLLDGVEMISFFSDEELALSKIDPALLADPNYVKAGGYLHGFEEFDAPFFQMTRSEAEAADPQQRVFLEIAWEALEHAGYDPENYGGRIGVYGGAGKNHYAYRIFQNPALQQRYGGLQISIGNDPDMLATQLAYKLNLKGPSLTVQTACSTSLVAVHQACQSLLMYESDMVLAGGVSIRSLQKEGYLFQEGSILSPDGHCRTFDAQAKGTVPGDGAGLVVLKRLEDAVTDGDTIYAVIRGSAINNDGSLKTGFTAPSVEGQANVIAEALAIADVEPETIQYVETHGTATPLGDPIDVKALTLGYQASTGRNRSTKIGSVKTNIGHLDTAAGVASLIKTALSLSNDQIPQTLHFEQGNPQIDFANLPFAVLIEAGTYDRTGEPARAAVSSFGIGGTNAHVILEEAPEAAHEPAHRKAQLLLLSAKTDTALKTATDHLVEHLRTATDAPLADIAYTLQEGRRGFAHRRFVVAGEHGVAAELLAALDAKRVVTRLNETEQQPLVLLFPGQGAQYVGMARELYETEPLFKKTLDQCAELLKPQLGRDLRELFYPAEENREAASELLKQTQFTQPAIYVIEYAMAQLLLSFGIRPAAMIGHSIGEYVAATLAGVLSAEDAVSLIADRARLMQSLPSGKMLAVALSEQAVQAHLSGTLSVAAVNGPNACVVAGPEEEILELNARLQALEATTSLLNTSHAFHSAMMDSILPQFEERVRQVQLRAPELPYLSNVSGTWITAEQATDPSYWVQHLRQAVRFSDGISALLKMEDDLLFLEAGPGNVLSTLVRQQAKEAGRNVAGVFSVLRHRDDQTSDVTYLLHTMGQLWLHGAKIDWNGFHGEAKRRRVPLPTYPFERKSYLIEATEASVVQAAATKRPEVDRYYLPTWQRTAPAPRTTEATGVTLFFADKHGVAEACAERLSASTVIVREDAEFKQLAPNEFALNPANPDDYKALINALENADQLPKRIVHAWNVTDEALGHDRAQEIGFYSLVFLAQALGEVTVPEPIALTVLTHGLQDVTGQALQAPERATLYGALKVIAQENAKITTHTIDLLINEIFTATEAEAKAAHLLDPLVRELLADSDDFHIAYRNGVRWTQTFAPTTMPAGEPTTLRQGGVYLITGAAQGSGLAYAEYLSATCNARLVLIDSEEALNATADSARWQSLQVRGGDVLILAADLASEADVARAVRDAQTAFGTLHGVIHAVDVRGTGLMQLKTREQFASVLDLNVRPVLALQTALHGAELDFFALQSSTLAALGGFGQVEHVAAYNFYDAFAQSLASQGIHAFSINWSQWQSDTWQEEQMVLMPDVQAQLKDLRDTFGLSDTEALTAFETVLASGWPRALVSTLDFAQVLQEQKSLTAASFLKGADNARSGQAQETDENYIGPSNEIEATLAEMWQELLGIDRIGMHEDFFGLGGNSLLSIQIIARLRKLFNVEVAMTAIFEATTISALAEMIMEMQLEAANMEELEALLREIEGLSDEEITVKMTEE